MRKIVVPGALALALLLVSFIGSARESRAQASPRLATGPAGAAITIYSRDLGFVRERRALERAGAHAEGGSGDTARISDLPERLDFSSVRLTPLDGARVVRLAYRWDLAGGDALLESARGRRVSVTLKGERQTEGALVASDGTWLVLRADDGSLTTLARTAVETVRLAAPAATPFTRPTLEAVLEGGTGRREAELSYLTGGMSWSAEHTLARHGDREAVWSSSVVVENTTGRDWIGATVKLVAGELQRQTQPRPVPMRMLSSTTAMSAKGADLTEEAFSEYHLYALHRPVTLRDREQQSFSMIEPRAVKVTPRYLYRGGDPRGVMTQWEFPNTKAAGPGAPLPAGRVRCYEDDASGAPQLVGEASIRHTPEGEKVTLDVGAAFDLAAERREMSSRQISPREREYSVEVRLRNRKRAEVTILVDENVGGDTEITQKSRDFVRKDANTIEFTVPVPAGQEVVLTYTAHVRY
jgi:hypothetical protein